MVLPVENTFSPAETLRLTPAPDDAGAETADRYEWRAMMAAADVLSGYFRALDQVGNVLEEFGFTVVCEHHEDWAIVRESSSMRRPVSPRRSRAHSGGQSRWRHT
jgi:hypothetical protein